MNKNRRNAIVLGIIGVVALVVFYKMFFAESEFDRQYKANQAKGPQPAAAGAQQAGGQPAATAGTAAATPATPGTKGPTRSQFKKADVDVEAIAASVKEVTFDYDQDRTRVNPMTPLVGPMAPIRLAAAASIPGQTASDQQDIQAMIRKLKLTGILWSKTSPLAVINDEVVTRGHVFEGTGIKVQDIEHDRVIVSVNDVLVPIEMEER